MLPRNLALASGLTALWGSWLRFVSFSTGALTRREGREGFSRTTLACSMLGIDRESNPMFSMRLSGLTKFQAEEMLDWLENHGVCDSQVEYVMGQGFTVWHG